MKLGIIGGSGLETIDGLENLHAHMQDTPFGRPSDQIVEGTVGETSLVFLSRHGQGHVVAPSATSS